MNENISLIYPKKIAKYLIALIMVLALTFEWANTTYFHDTFTTPFSLHWFVLTIRNLGLFLFVFFLLFFSIRAGRAFKLGLRGFVLPLLSIFLAGVFAYLGHVQNIAFKLQKESLTIDIRQVEDRLDNHLFRHNSFEDKLSASREFAEAVYNEMGKKIEVLTKENTYVIFEPSKASINLYKSKQAHLKEIKERDIYFPIYVWILIVVLGVAAGSFSPIRK